MDAERSVSRAFREWVQFFILLFATVWGVYTFVYKEAILPARRPATLTVTTQLDELGRTEETVLVRLRVHAVNRTDRKIYVPALWYTVRGLRLERQDGELEQYRAQVEYTPEAELQARYSAITAADVVAVGTILNQVTDYYNPTDETTNEVLFQVPRDQYDALEAKAQFFVTKESEGLSMAGWRVGQGGELNPQILLSGRPYDPGYNAQHYAWATSVGAGFNWASSTLSLWDGSRTATGPDAVSADPRISMKPSEAREE